VKRPNHFPVPTLVSGLWNAPKSIRLTLLANLLGFLVGTVATYVVWTDGTTTIISAFSLSYVVGSIGSYRLYRRLVDEEGTSDLAVALREQYRAWAWKCALVAIAFGQLALAREGLFDDWIPLAVRNGTRLLAILAVIYAHLSLVYVDSIHRVDIYLEAARREATEKGYGPRDV